MEEDEKHHHVHFEASDELSHENNITVKQSDTGKIDIHIGFLQVVATPTKFHPKNIFRDFRLYFEVLFKILFHAHF